MDRRSEMAARGFEHSNLTSNQAVGLAKSDESNATRKSHCK